MNNDSSWAGLHDSPLDRAIDRAVREMVQVDPPPGLRRRVLSRLDAAKRPSARITVRYAWAAAAFVIMIAAVMFTRERPDAPVTTVPVASQTAVVPAPTPETRRPIVVPPPPTTPRATASRITREAIPMPRVTNVFGAPSRGVVAASDSGVEAIVTSPAASTPEPPGAVPALVIPPLTAAPIETPAIVIPPLTSAAPKGGL
jgi:hypothetical protein